MTFAAGAGAPEAVRSTASTSWREVWAGAVKHRSATARRAGVMIFIQLTPDYYEGFAEKFCLVHFAVDGIALIVRHPIKRHEVIFPFAVFSPRKCLSARTHLTYYRSTTYLVS